MKFVSFIIISGEIDIRRFRLKHHHTSELTYGCQNPLTMIEQQFEYIAVVDFEATCEEKQRNNYRHEIIEFPIVLINVQEQTIVNYVNQIKLITNHFFSD